MLCKRTTVFPIECVIRGYLSGSAWKEYAGSGTLAGEKLPAGLVESIKLEPSIFSPATKAETGHDENIPFAQAEQIVGADIARQARDASLKLYSAARDYARQRGIIIADTKFEFGHTAAGLVLADEVLTPDSSRFWPADKYKPGGAQESFDKQYVRDYLEEIHFNKKPPAPELPPAVVKGTTEKYLEAYRLLTGKPLA